MTAPAVSVRPGRDGGYTPTNTHLLFAEFDYARPATIADACALLEQHGGAAHPIAGGTDLLVQMKLERARPAVVVSLAGIPELDAVADGDVLKLGAGASIRRIASAAAVRERYTALAEACSAFSTVPIMIMATVGGNLCNASPAADTAPALLAFDATVTLVSGAGERVVALDDFFVGPGSTVLGDGEILRDVELGEPQPATGSAFIKVGRVSADISKVAVAVRIVRDGERIASCRIALGAVAPTPVRARAAEAHLAGQVFRPALLDEASALVSDGIRPITDIRSTADFRYDVAAVSVRDALVRAWVRSGGEEVE